MFTQFRKHCSDRFKCTDTDTNKDTNTFRNTYTNIGMTNLNGQPAQQPHQTLSAHWECREPVQWLFSQEIISYSTLTFLRLVHFCWYQPTLASDPRPIFVDQPLPLNHHVSLCFSGILPPYSILHIIKRKLPLQKSSIIKIRFSILIETMIWHEIGWG